ncbi:PAS domain-containing protein [Pseudomonas cavernicola]|uniref:PAS domain-containing protein n=1 Tax=Pseudomonas cavernicola TaxID=2320866 RepID=A0A418X9C0_9PSED|nr:PAS domain-containing protein [Pseudomonas cavernicola]
MRINMPLSGRECIYPADQRLISSTDTRGRITYCNDEFVAVSGFSREQLIGSPHNLVRHPEMPAQVFAQMWEYLKAGKCGVTARSLGKAVIEAFAACHQMKNG